MPDPIGEGGDCQRENGMARRDRVTVDARKNPRYRTCKAQLDELNARAESLLREWTTDRKPEVAAEPEKGET